MPIQHISASASHYDQEAKHYDVFNEARSALMNQRIEDVLRDHAVQSVLDLTCGTGSQVFWLIKQKFNVVGIDINAKMLEIARHKAKQQNLSLRFEQGDMRTSQIGQFDAVLTIFNAIGHLTQKDFELAIQNVSANLKLGGLYIFDIFNLDYLLFKDNITKLTIDWQKRSGEITAREIQYSTISPSGVLASYDIYHEEVAGSEPTVTTAVQTLQVYRIQQLQALLQRYGFEIIQKSSVDGTPFILNETPQMFIVAQKIKFL